MHEDALRQLLALRTANPHGLLGAHQAGGEVFFRVFRADATKVVVTMGKAQATLEPRPGFPGIFEGRLTAGALAPYELELHFAQGTSREKDPYAFLPTLGPADLHFVGEGRHRRLWDRLGAHPLTHQGVTGTAFVVWAPNAEGVSVVGDFNRWDGRRHLMRSLGASGLWEIFVPGVAPGNRYKFEISPRGGAPFLKADPLAFRTEPPPLSASVVHKLEGYQWGDESWLRKREKLDAARAPMSIYEVHLGSWMRVPEDGNRSLTYRELAPKLAEHASRLGFTHVEFLPVAEHPFGGSWGYQVSGYYAPSARFGTPDDFRFLVDTLHQAGVGVLIDWVPGHFPRDTFALAQFDGTSLYEHADPRKGAHPDWGTLIFNFGRNEVRNFLVANALFWLEQYHVDGLRVDAVASMLYLDYSRKEGEWIPNQHGGRENEEAIGFLRELNDTVHALHPDVHVLAEESTSWPRVSRPTRDGGLGFTHKWNMGWMHDTLSYFQKDPIHRQHHHHQLTFGLLYAYSEDFVLPLSHDEVVHGKGSLANKMPGDEWQKQANLRALYGWMWAHPGKKLLFMGNELGQWTEWNHDSSVEWHLGAFPRHAGMMKLVGRLNALYRQEGSLFESDFWPQGFQWVQADAAADNVYIFVRRGHNAWREIVCVANMSPVVRQWRVGVPGGGWWAEILNTDAAEFGGSNVLNAPLKAEHKSWDGQPASVVITLPPLAVCWLAPIDEPKKKTI
ncbi:MAG: 1,4-alpha-glucan branching protein GlgB [Archangium sp.]|nr:1,4-alpha-glucan branching protein GlgB [Archangium sp.]